MAAQTELANSQAESFAHSHGSPIQTRSERLQSENPADYAPISRLEEQWKYTSSDQLAGLDSDEVSEYLGDINAQLGAGTATSWVGPESEHFGAAGIPEDLVSAVAWSAAAEAYLVDIAENESPSLSTITLDSNDSNPSALHLIVRASKHSESVVILDHVGTGVLAENIELIVEAGAKLTFVSVQDWKKGSVHAASHYAKLGRDAQLKHIVVTLGGDVVRVTPNAYLTSPGASVELLGAYFAGAKQHIENRCFVDHEATNCKSRVTYKGALQGDKAHTIWVGDVLIRATAEGTDTYELNRNLLLTDGARADSVPNLEIETGQIEGAGHASASGRFDDEQLFYLQSRGITELDARRLVVQGFLNEVIQQIDSEAIRERLSLAIEAELVRGLN